MEGFKHMWLKSKYLVLIVLKDQEFGFDKSTKDFKGLKSLDLKWYLKSTKDFISNLLI